MQLILGVTDKRPYWAGIIEQVLPGNCNTVSLWSSWNNVYLLIWLIGSPDLSIVKPMKNWHPTCKSECCCQQFAKLYVKSCRRNECVIVVFLDHTHFLWRIPQLQIAIFIRIMCQLCVICTCATEGLAKYWKINLQNFIIDPSGLLYNFLQGIFWNQFGPMDFLL